VFRLSDTCAIVTLSLRQSIADLTRAITVSTVLTGLLIVIVGFTGSLALIFEVARNAKLPTEALTSWVFAIVVGSGISTVLLSLLFKQPMLVAWSTPGLALLATSLQNYTLAEAVAAYIASALFVIVLGLTGLFERMLNVVPQSVALAVLAGILLKFGLGLFSAWAANPSIVVPMVLMFVLAKRFAWHVPMAWVVLAGVLAAFATGQVVIQPIPLALTLPSFYAPVFSVRALIGLAVPLSVLALASQHAPGFAVLRAAGYDPQIKAGLIGTGLISLLTAPLLGHGLTMAAITAALATSPDAHPNKSLRYGAAVVTGALKIALGVFGATVVAVFRVLPAALISALAGLALLGTIQHCLSGAFAESEDRDGALFALLMAASGVTLLGLGSAFWGLVIGVAWRFMRRVATSKQGT
jgi:benzoate membrane transport protein